MARKNQILINYHTSSLTSMPLASDVELGEIVVRHADERPELLLKTNNGEFAVVPASGAVASAISGAITVLEGNVNGTIADVNEAIENHVKEFNQYKEDAAAEFATKGELSGNVETLNGNINTAKGEAIAAASAYTDSAVATAKEELEGDIKDVDSKVNTLSSATETFKGEVARTYATSAQTVAAIAAAKGEAIDAAAKYTDGEIAEVFTSATTVAAKELELAVDTLDGNIEGVDSKVNTLSSATEAFKSEVATTYATSAHTVNAINVAKNAAIAAASTYTDGEIAEVFTSATTVAANALTTAKEEIMGEVTDLESAMNSGFTAVRGELSATTEDLTELINNKVSVAYRYAGSCTYAELTGKTAQYVGEVWNVTDANGNFPAGTNYAWNGSAWDALGGSVDLTPFLKTSDFNTYKEEVAGEFEDIRSEISDANSGTSILEEYVKETYATSAATVTAISTAKNEAVAAASAYTDTEIAEVYASATTAAANALATAKEEIEGSIAAANALISDNAEAIKGVKATADTAVQSYSVNCGVKAENKSTVGTFDFSEMVIDGGEF